MKLLKTCFLVAIGVCVIAGTGWAQTSQNKVAKGFGLRAGYGTNPDQFVIGAQAVLGKTQGPRTAWSRTPGTASLTLSVGA